MTKKTKGIDKTLLNKLKPLEIKSENKKQTEKKAEIKDSKKDVPNDFIGDSNFSDNSIWQTKTFVAPILNEAKDRPAALETTAKEMPLSNQNEDKKEGEIYSTGVQKSESAAYRISSNYEHKTDYESGRTGEDIRPTMNLRNEQRRAGLTNPFVRPEEIQRSELEEFSRLEEQRREEREESEKLPFMQKKRREEIF